MSKIYISGPITGTDDYLGRFAAAEARITAAGHAAMNPARICACMPESEWHEYMQVAMVLLRQCDTIYMLNNWQGSEGAKRELVKASEWNMKVIMEGEDIAGNSGAV